mmetsp:Transcript_17547/g.61697  ORF Transcript_17547/g.61697 Transcript_17547/m.61697 type:complete len:273 (-) Transcript_17547:256-1074(-)
MASGPRYGPKVAEWDPTLSGAELPLRPAVATWPKPIWADPRRCPSAAEVNFYLRELRHPPAWAVKENADRAIAAAAAKVTRLDARPPPKGCSMPKNWPPKAKKRRHTQAATAATAEAGASLRDLIPGLNNLPVAITPSMQKVLEGVAVRNHVKRLGDIDRRGKVAAANIRAEQRAAKVEGGGAGGHRRGSDATSALTTPYQREWMTWRRRDEDIKPIPAFAASARERFREIEVEKQRRERTAWHKRQQEISRRAAKQLAKETTKMEAFKAYG